MTEKELADVQAAIAAAIVFSQIKKSGNLKKKEG